MRVSKNTALAVNRFPKRKAESPVVVFEKDGHLQLCLFDVLSSGDGRLRRPHRLRDYRAPIYDAAVK